MVWKGRDTLLPICLHDKDEIERLLRHDNVYLHLYEIGDLDDLYWPHTTWYTLPQKSPKPVLLLYSGLALPTLLGLTEKSTTLLQRLLQITTPLLPARCYTHLTPELSSPLKDRFDIQSHGIFYKMALLEPDAVKNIDTSAVVPLHSGDQAELLELYRLGYPGHWFEPHMLDRGYYYGVRHGSKLVSAAGVHVYSTTYKVAALGNVATHPGHRNQGLAQAACARLCQDLLATVDAIGLNVKADSESAIACYHKLGFRPVGTYEECTVEWRG
jgi:GNAT superfamily N-acetyltransferase